ncbi:glycosyltransferase [Thiohalobacter sp. IOR34]|uniref:glycosyltransferase n=1 Tax=Thiohalobacter sp. IOR34 TaxID=3057176 RepID=UPI0025B026F9|nr:glycosyltransferase [Thiohalobacter sp. IOR34]WJW76308.1 glycosyltransferase [Thiohalobacter sp. IOR34]
MRILVVSVVYNSTPPIGYGGIQRVVHSLVEALVEFGHEVTLVAPPRSRCSGRTVEVAAYDPDRPWVRIRREGDLLSEEPLYETLVELTRREQFDVIHDWSFQNLFPVRHPDVLPAVISTCIPPPPGFSRSNLVASSKAHAELCGEGTRYVHYGLPLDDWEYTLSKSDELVHIAKIARYKAQHLAIMAARRSGRKLALAGNVEEPLYYNALVRPLLWMSRHVSYLGEISGTEDCLREAAALVQTPRWFDAFPLVILEALASATPVIAFAEGGVPEQVIHGETGFLCHDLSSLTEAFERLPEIDPQKCRDDAERRFSSRRMAEDYLDLYRRAMAGDNW